MDNKVTVLTWNILADAYDSSKMGFDERSSAITRAIKALDTDIILLQEVDHWQDYFLPVFVETATHEYRYYQRPTRRDGIVTLFRKDRFEVVDESKDVMYINYDDIADVLDDEGQNGTSFRRQNVGLLLRLRLKEDNTKSFVVANTHLYWSPAKPEVKLAQMRMLMKSIEELAETQSRRFLPVIMGGDFNSVPTSDLYRRIQDNAVFQGGVLGSYTGNDAPPKFVADTSLKKLCSWLRMLGVDCAMESEESELARTAKPVQNFDPFFSMARAQNRIILTSSRKLTERANCPLNFYVRTNNFEAALVQIVKTFDVEISENTFLTVCGKCGGRIRKSSEMEIRESFSSVEYLPEDGRPLFQCVECMQPYWWNERVDSSPARAMRVASRLFSIIESDRKGEPVSGKSANLPSSVYANGVSEEERSLRNVYLTAGQDEDLNKLFANRDSTIFDQATDSAKSGVLEEKDHVGDILRFSSAYAVANESEATFTNWAKDFKGTLDYIFISSDDFNAKDARVIPGILSDAGDESNEESLGYPHIVRSYNGTPNAEWPSDHFIVTADLEIV